MTKASFANQARIHQGYHYPRSLLTARRSRLNFSQFVLEFSDCVDSSFTKIYAIGSGSKVSPSQFQQFCNRIGAPIRDTRDEHRSLFNPRLVSASFEVTEYAFDARILAKRMKTSLAEREVIVRYNTTAKQCGARQDQLYVETTNGAVHPADWIFNCTYAGLNRISGIEPIPMKLEMAEIALIIPPSPLARIGITLMDGPFFSTLPFPRMGLHSLSHVRYTPHYSWIEGPGGLPDLPTTRPRTHVKQMLRDATRYVPCIEEAVYRQSLWSPKAVLPQSEVDDSRPILFRPNSHHPRIISVLGGKIDNILDIRERVRSTLTSA